MDKRQKFHDMVKEGYSYSHIKRVLRCSGTQIRKWKEESNKGEKISYSFSGHMQENIGVSNVKFDMKNIGYFEQGGRADFKPIKSVSYKNGEVEIDDDMTQLEKILERFSKKGIELKIIKHGIEPELDLSIKPYNGNPNNVLVIGDIHEPYSLDGYLKHCRETQEKFDCGKIIFVGDIAELNSFNYHELIPEELNPSGEISKCRARLQNWYKTFPKATVLLGNHDLLIYRKARTAGLLREFINNPHSIFQAPDSYDFVKEVEIDNVLYTHGTNGDAFTKCVKEGMNLVQGHLHQKGGIVFSRNRKGQIRGMQTGTGINYDSICFDYARTSAKMPVLSCGVVLNKGTLPIVVPYNDIN